MGLTWYLQRASTKGTKDLNKGLNEVLGSYKGTVLCMVGVRVAGKHREKSYL